MSIILGLFFTFTFPDLLLYCYAVILLLKFHTSVALNKTQKYYVTRFYVSSKLFFFSRSRRIELHIIWYDDCQRKASRTRKPRGNTSKNVFSNLPTKKKTITPWHRQKTCEFLYKRFAEFCVRCYSATTICRRYI